jgi:hypothetical protein
MAIKRRIVTTLPTTLAEGEEVYYRDSNGVQTLWVGNASGEAWPAVGYKELRIHLSVNNLDVPTFTIIKNETSIAVQINEPTRQSDGRYYFKTNVDNASFFLRPEYSFNWSLVDSYLVNARVNFDYIGGAPSQSTAAIRVDVFGVSGYVDARISFEFVYKQYPS